MANLQKYMSARRRKVVALPGTLELMFDPRVAFRRVETLIRGKETAYVCGCLRSLQNGRIISALETKMGVQLLMCSKARARDRWLYRGFRAFRGHPVRSLGSIRKPSVEGTFLIGLSLDHRCLWVYSGHELGDDPRHLNTSMVLHKEEGAPWVTEYLRLFEISEV